MSVVGIATQYPPAMSEKNCTIYIERECDFWAFEAVARPSLTFDLDRFTSIGYFEV